MNLGEVLREFEQTAPAEGDELSHFHDTYRRQTMAIDDELERGGFLDPDWVARWDAVFAGLYFDALRAWLDGRDTPHPWRLAFEAARDPDVRPLIDVLISVNAHANYDLPRSLLAMMTDDELADADLVRRRQVDFQRIDDTLVSRVKEEDLHLRAVSGPGDITRLDRMLTPFNRAASRRFLKEARRKVWANTQELARARRVGREAYEARIHELERICAAKVADLVRPGQVVLRLGVKGFGVVLPRAT